MIAGGKQDRLSPVQSHLKLSLGCKRCGVYSHPNGQSLKSVSQTGLYPVGGTGMLSENG